MAVMKAAVLVEPGRFVIEQRPIPDPGPGEVLLRITRCGICGTDIHIFKGHYSADCLPMVPGHEFTGRIAALGPGVTRLEIEQKVVVDTNIGCGTCFFCRRGEILNCPDMVQMGIHVDGGFADYLVVPAHLVIPAPDHIPDDALALTEPLACVVRAARKAQVSFGQSVVVLGAGPIGNLHVQLMRTLGAAPIIVFDIVADRAAAAVGADVTVSDPDQLRGAVLRATGGRGADLVIESVGSAKLYQTAQELVRNGGHIAAFGLTGPNEVLELDILTTILRENSVKGSVAGIGENMHDALTLLVHGRIDTGLFTDALFDLDDIQSAFDTFHERQGDLKTQIVMAAK